VAQPLHARILRRRPDRCAATFTWWRNPYTRESCAADPTRVEQPAGYLLPYWMARYHGFAPP
jgi:hypothetical protein